MKSMKKCCLFFVLSILPALITAEKVTTLSQPLNPHKIIVSGNQMIVEDFPKIHIFSLEDFRLQRSFGEKGEAPGEFLPRSGYVRLNIHVQKDFIFVESNGKLSFFSRDGTFLREMNSAAAGYLFQPMGKNKFIGLRNVGEKGMLYKTVNIYDSNLKIKKEIFRIKHGSQAGKSIVLFDKALRYFMDGRCIYIVHDFDFLIEVFDRNGNHVRTIHKKDYRHLEITEEHKRRTHNHLKRHLRTYPQMKHRLKFPSTFLAVRDIELDDRKLYVTTFKREKGTVECFIIDQEGTIQERLFLPLIEENILREYPFDIHNGKVYQLVENEETEHWELHMSGIR